jgi:hypothetical protein
MDSVRVLVAVCPLADMDGVLNWQVAYDGRLAQENAGEAIADEPVAVTVNSVD